MGRVHVYMVSAKQKLPISGPDYIPVRQKPKMYTRAVSSIVLLPRYMSSEVLVLERFIQMDAAG